MAAFFNSLSDDQLALLGTAAALAVCSTLMWASFYLGRGIRADRPANAEAEPITIPMPQQPVRHTRRKAA